jgi:SAM-dependent methyltransferase
MPISERSARSIDPAGRTPERLRFHYEVERELAGRLRSASSAERGALYAEVYDELFRRVTDHPQLTSPRDPELGRRKVAEQEALVHRFLRPGGVFLEIGAGDCALSLAVCSHASQVYAIEVSRTIAHVESTPPNFQLLITDGISIPVPPGSVDLAYSNQLMEHLHPDDAEEQAANVATAMRKGGKYVCLTPHRLLGPTDISAFFTRGDAKGFHLREYSTRELTQLFRAAGFSKVQVLVHFRGNTVAAPGSPFRGIDLLFGALPARARSWLRKFRVVKKIVQPGGGVVAIR